MSKSSELGRAIAAWALQTSIDPRSEPEPTPPPDPITLRPLTERLRDLLATIPESAKANGLELRELQARLKGRQGKSCNAAELGAALRTLGWKRFRGWSDNHGGFVARWYFR